MKRILILVLGVLMITGAANAACLKTGLQLDITSLVDTVYFNDNVGATAVPFAASHLWIHLASDASGAVTIQRGVRTSATTVKFIDDAFTIQPGGEFKSGDENIWCFKMTKTAASDGLYSIASTCELSNLDIGTVEVVTDNVLLTNGYLIPASGIETFNTPLTPVGDHSTVSFTVKCIGTAPDTTYFQIVAANTSMDSLTALNIGTLAVPVVSGAWPAAVFAGAHPFHNTGVEFPLGISIAAISNAKFIGIRLSPDDSRAGTYYVVCNPK